MSQLAVSVAGGAIVGAVLGMLGFWRSTAEGTSDPGLPLVVQIGLPALGGAAAGIVLHALKGIRGRGRLGHYMAWVSAGIVGMAGILLPELLDGVGVQEGALIVALGVGAGLGLGAFARQLSGHVW
jgi:hypothetical protein